MTWRRLAPECHMGNASHAPRRMAAFLAASSVLAISVNKCDHVSERKLISTFSYDLRMQDVYELYHPPLADCSKQ